MSVRLLRNSLSREMMSAFEESLKFYPATRDRNCQVTTNPVVCFRSDPDDEYDSVPLIYARDKWGMDNCKVSHHSNVSSMCCATPQGTQKTTVEKVTECIVNNKACLIKSKPGSGKTVMALMVSSRFRLRTVILLQSLTLVGQWVNAVQDFTDATVWVVELKDETPLPEYYPDIIICLNRRWSIIERRLRDTVGFVIVDECPLHCNQYGADALLSFCPRYVLGLSATPSRSRDSMYVVMEQFIGTSTVEQIDIVSVDLIKVTTEYVGKRVISRGKVMWTTLNQSFMYNRERNEVIMGVVKERLSKGYKIMMLTTECNHVETLSSMLKEYDIEHDTFYRSKKTYNNSPVLVANTQKASIGFDEAGTSCVGFDGKRINCVVFCSSVATPENIIQAAGRAFRATDTTPCVVHIVDNDVTIKKHFGTALTAYDQHDYMVSVTERKASSYY